MRKTKYYMHTLDGKPACYDGDQICFMTHGTPLSRFPTSLAQVRQEQKSSDEWRQKQGYDLYYRAGYLRISE